MYPQQQPYAPPARRRSKAPLVLILVATALAALGVLVVGVIVASGDDEPATLPSTVATSGAASNVAVPGADLGAGTPGAPCSTDRLGKQFTKDGVVYTCKGPKPYSWQP